MRRERIALIDKIVLTPVEGVLRIDLHGEELWPEVGDGLKG
jgi:hypothetical protein